MRRQMQGLYTQGRYTLFSRISGITRFILIVEQCKLQTGLASRGQGFQMCGKNLPLRTGHVIWLQTHC